VEPGVFPLIQSPAWLSSALLQADPIAAQQRHSFVDLRYSTLRASPAPLQLQLQLQSSSLPPFKALGQAAGSAFRVPLQPTMSTQPTPPSALHSPRTPWQQAFAGGPLLKDHRSTTSNDLSASKLSPSFGHAVHSPRSPPFGYSDPPLRSPGTSSNSPFTALESEREPAYSLHSARPPISVLTAVGSSTQSQLDPSSSSSSSLFPSQQPSAPLSASSLAYFTAGHGHVSGIDPTAVVYDEVGLYSYPTL